MPRFKQSLSSDNLLDQIIAYCITFLLRPSSFIFAKVGAFIISKQLQILVRDMNVFYRLVKKYFVFKFFFLMSTFLSNAMKSMMLNLY